MPHRRSQMTRDQEAIVALTAKVAELEAALKEAREQVQLRHKAYLEQYDDALELEGALASERQRAERIIEAIKRERTCIFAKRTPDQTPEETLKIMDQTMAVRAQLRREILDEIAQDPAVQPDKETVCGIDEPCYCPLFGLHSHTKKLHGVQPDAGRGE